MRHFGLPIRARAIANICCSPPESGTGVLRDPLLQPRKNGKRILDVIGNPRFIAAQIGAHHEIFVDGQIRKHHASLGHVTEMTLTILCGARLVISSPS